MSGPTLWTLCSACGLRFENESRAALVEEARAHVAWHEERGEPRPSILEPEAAAEVQDLLNSIARRRLRERMMREGEL